MTRRDPLDEFNASSDAERYTGDALIRALTTPLIRIPAFSTGDRVIIPPTSGAPDPVFRAGGPGTVCWVREVEGEAFYYVAADGAQDTPQPFRVDELQLEPPV